MPHCLLAYYVAVVVDAADHDDVVFVYFVVNVVVATFGS